MKKSKLPIPTEDQECQAFVDYLELRKKLLFTHISNETQSSWGARMRNKRLGVRPGFPDYAVVVNNKLIFIEMKRKKGSVTSEEQTLWIQELNKVNEIIAGVFHGAEQAINFIEQLN